MSHRPLVAFVVVPLLAPAACTGGRECTLVGGFDTVTVVLHGADSARSYLVEACVEDRCGTGRTYPGQSAAAGAAADGLVDEDTSQVRVTVKDLDGTVLGPPVVVRASTPQRWYPNGKRCEPSLWRTDVTVDVPRSAT